MGIYTGCEICDRKQALYDRLIDDLPLTVRSLNALENAGIAFIGELVQRKAADLLRLRNLGRVSLRNVVSSLSEVGLTLEMDISWRPPPERPRPSWERWKPSPPGRCTVCRRWTVHGTTIHPQCAQVLASHKASMTVEAAR